MDSVERVREHHHQELEAIAHLNRLIRRYDVNMFLVTGPGHGAPANLANLYLERSLLGDCKISILQPFN